MKKKPKCSNTASILFFLVSSIVIDCASASICFRSARVSNYASRALNRALRSVNSAFLSILSIQKFNAGPFKTGQTRRTLTERRNPSRLQNGVYALRTSRKFGDSASTKIHFWPSVNYLLALSTLLQNDSLFEKTGDLQSITVLGVAELLLIRTIVCSYSAIRSDTSEKRLSVDANTFFTIACQIYGPHCLSTLIRYLNASQSLTYRIFIFKHAGWPETFGGKSFIAA